MRDCQTFIILVLHYKLSEDAGYQKPTAFFKTQLKSSGGPGPREGRRKLRFNIIPGNCTRVTSCDQNDGNFHMGILTATIIYVGRLV